MTDWIEHDGGPQPVADDVMVEVCATVDYTVNLDDGLQLSQFAPWARKFKYRILNQHLIDAARREGIRLGLEAAMKIVWKDARWMGSDGPRIGEKLWLTLRDLDSEAIAQEAKPTA